MCVCVQRPIPRPRQISAASLPCRQGCLSLWGGRNDGTRQRFILGTGWGGGFSRSFSQHIGIGIDASHHEKKQSIIPLAIETLCISVTSNTFAGSSSSSSSLPSDSSSLLPVVHLPTRSQETGSTLAHFYFRYLCYLIRQGFTATDLAGRILSSLITLEKPGPRPIDPPSLY